MLLPQRVLLWLESLSGMCAKLHTVAARNNKDHMSWSLFYCLFMSHIYGCYSSHISRLWWIARSTPRQPRGWNSSSSFLQQTASIACSFYEVSTWHDLHILVTAPFCCDQKARAACAQKLHTVAASNNRDHMPWSLLLLVHTTHIYIWVFFFAHIPFVVNRTFNAMPTERLQQCLHNILHKSYMTALLFFQKWHANAMSDKLYQ